MAEKPKTLEETGFKVGDLVLYTSIKDSTGGVIFQIVERTDPVEPAIRQRVVKVTRERFKAWPGHSPSYWDQKPGVNGEMEKYEEEKREYGAWDANGKKLMEAATHGFVRIKPIFDFFATSKGKNPVGKGNTIIIYYEALKNALRPVDLVLLGAKYMELGNIMRDIVRRGSED